jgi:hypothetical protein
MNNVVEQDHRFVLNRRIRGMNIIRKRSYSPLPEGDVIGQTRFIERIPGIASQAVAEAGRTMRRRAIASILFATLPRETTRGRRTGEAGAQF